MIYAYVFLILTILLLLIFSFVIIAKPQYGLFGLLFCVYHLLFYAFPGVLHTLNNTFPFYSMSYPVPIIEIASILSFVFVFSVAFGYLFYGNVKPESLVFPQSGLRNSLAAEFLKNRTFFLLWSMFTLQAISIVYFGIDSFISRRDADLDAAFGEASHTSALFSNGVRGLSFICMLVALFALKCKPSMRYLHIALAAILFLTIT